MADVYAVAYENAGASAADASGRVRLHSVQTERWPNHLLRSTPSEPPRDRSATASADGKRQQQKQQHQPQQDNNGLQQVWEEQGIEAWAAITTQELLERLRDNDGNPLAPETVAAVQQMVAGSLGKRCTTQAEFMTRRRIAQDAELLLQCALDLGANERQWRNLVNVS